MKYLLLSLLFLMNIHASEVIENDVIDIDGSFQTARQETPAEKLKKLRQKLEKENELMVKRKIETMRLQQEMEMTQKIQNAFEQNMKKLSEI